MIALKKFPAHPSRIENFGHSVGRHSDVWYRRIDDGSLVIVILAGIQQGKHHHSRRKQKERFELLFHCFNIKFGSPYKLNKRQNLASF
jgi:hypothetical protein